MDKADNNSANFEGEASFEKRKKDHIYWSLSDKSQADLSPSQLINLPHDPIPEIDFADVSLETESKLFNNSKPFLISSMTGGHDESESINYKLAKAAAENNWLFSTGSLRREVEDKDLKTSEWSKIRSEFKNANLIGNIGLPQIIDPLLRKKLVNFLMELKFDALFVHLNPLQEALQIEGTPNYKNGFSSLKSLIDELNIPVLLKETGTGFSRNSVKKIKQEEVDVKAIDVSGFGGTHWGRIEGLRTPDESKFYKASNTFKNWGHSTVESLLSLNQEKGLLLEPWASGGLRNGLDAAICFALGARVCGFAMPFMKAAVSKDIGELKNLIELIEYETKIALFCTGSKNITELRQNSSKEGGWSWKK